MIVFDLVYGLVLLLISPWLILRSIRTGRYRKHLRAKLFGSTNIQKLDGRPVVWFHGVSVGEVHLLSPVIQAFQARFPSFQPVVSSTTDTGLTEADKRFPNLSVLPFPFDFSWAIDRTMVSLQPQLIVLAENELWPNFLRIANQRKIPVIVINGRMSPRSQRRNQKLRWFAWHLLFKRISLFAMQTEGYADAIRSLGVPEEKVIVSGSVKYDGAVSKDYLLKADELKSLFRIHHTEPIWVAGSTHEPEELVALQTYRKVLLEYPELRLILVPRSPDRFNAVTELIEREGFQCVRRSSLIEPIEDLSAVIMVDTMGELTAVWSLATFGYVGGSVDGKRGGQSMIEPAGLGVPTIFGPHVWNFREAAYHLVSRNGAIQIREAKELLNAVQTLLTDQTKRHAMGVAAKQFVQEQQGATIRTMDLLEPYLKAIDDA
jgi:3-deoxy-D-manno-octulosonic-acid transferase